jgi:hypothetical protein
LQPHRTCQLENCSNLKPQASAKIKLQFKNQPAKLAGRLDDEFGAIQQMNTANRNQVEG